MNSPSWPYWYAAFPAQLFEPLSPDVIFTVGILLVSEVFPDRTQALAGAVFNTVGQFGQAIGLALIGVVSDSVTLNSKYANKNSSDALWTGYRAGFWTLVFGKVAELAFRGIVQYPWRADDWIGRECMWKQQLKPGKEKKMNPMTRKLQ
ncbi:MAG: hypothetical protein Q9161_004582 [Pseudevernia consocians]